MTNFIDLDVRPILRNGGEPFSKIMETIAALEPGQGLRLIATFKPTPLLHVLGSKGFASEAKELGGGEWQVEFTPSATPCSEGHTSSAPAADELEWPKPVQHLDNRNLDPPEPMTLILAATEAMAPGQVLSALLCREPVFLLPELTKRGHRWRGAFEEDGATYKILVRVGPGNGAVP